MKVALITLFLVASTGTSVAFAQEGMGHGPPSAPTTVPTPTILPTTQPATTGTTPKTAAAHLGTILNEMGPVISSESRKRGLRLA